MTFSGQRYHVILDATPRAYNNTPRFTNGSEYWLRMIPATDCSNFATGNTPDERQGIIYYAGSKNVYPNTARPTLPLGCRDEPYNQLVPIVPWQIDQPANDRRLLILFK